MKLRLFAALAIVAAMAVGVAVGTPDRASAQTPSVLTAPVVTDTFTGQFDVASFRADGRRLFAVGTLTGTLSNGQQVSRPLELPVITNNRGGNDDDDDDDEDDAIDRDTQAEWFFRTASTQASCPILRLVLGPLDLNLLGLRVQLNQIDLRITAVPGPGNLLGNLLCAIAGVLDPSGPPRVITLVADLLNALLGLGAIRTAPA